jgi:hypothetical protein
LDQRVNPNQTSVTGADLDRHEKEIHEERHLAFKEENLPRQFPVRQFLQPARVVMSNKGRFAFSLSAP